MIDLEQWMSAINYEIVEGWNPGWKTFGDYTHAYSATKSNSFGKYICELNCEFSKYTKEVFLIEAHDLVNRRSYRWIHDDFKKKYEEDFVKYGLEFDYALDDVKFIDLSAESDILRKTMSIYEGITYDERVEVPLDLNDDEIYELMKRAHEQDVTLNQYVTSILVRYIADFNEKNNLALK